MYERNSFLAKNSAQNSEFNELQICKSKAVITPNISIIYQTKRLANFLFEHKRKIYIL